MNKIIFIKTVKKITADLSRITQKKIFILDWVFNNNNLKNKILIKGELEKNFKKILNIIDFFIKKKYNNQTLLISIGGGVTGDISGFIASFYTRGIKYFNIPTTVVAQVDSSIGGKNGVNCENAKNMLGTIYLANKTYICDWFLKTLNKKILLDGFAEVVKICIINNKPLFFYILKKKNIKKIIYYSILSKINILKNNILDKNKRLYLNLGHTFAHAIENYFNYKISHGKAVFLGILFSLYISERLAFLKKKTFNKILKVIRKFFSNYLEYAKLLDSSVFNTIRFDKKTTKKNIQIVLVKKIGQVFIFKTKTNYILKIFDFKCFIKRIS